MNSPFLSHPWIQPLARQLAALSQRWGLQPQAFAEGLMFWSGWTGLTWLAFLLSLLFVEVGEKSDISLTDGLLGGCLVGLAQWQVLKPYVRAAHRWPIATALSWGVLALLHIGAIGWMAPSTPNLLTRVVFGLFYGAYVGLGLGLGQWLVVRRQIARAWRWMPINAGIWAIAIAFGWLIGGGLRAASNLFISEVIGLILAWGAIAALTGLGILSLLYQQRPQPASSQPAASQPPPG